MSYATKIDEMVGKHVAEFQAELTLAKQLSSLQSRPSLPYGYPVRVYHPRHTVPTPTCSNSKHPFPSKPLVLTRCIPFFIIKFFTQSRV